MLTRIESLYAIYKGTRVVVRRDYIYRMYMRGAQQVWTYRLRQYRKQRSYVHTIISWYVHMYVCTYIHTDRQIQTADT